MAPDHLKFLNLGRHDPDVLPVTIRRERFAEIYEAFDSGSAKDQSERCLDCGNPYCEWKCPVHNYIPDWLALVAEGRIEEACELAHETNSLPEMCGRICPQDRLCEGACTLETGFGAVTIGAVEKYLVDEAFARGWRPDLSQVEQTPHHVGIVGAGPAGLACADVLLRNGVAVTVYDRYPEIGGLLSLGIPEFKLELDVVRRRRQVFEDMGMVFKLSTEVGRDVSAAELLERHDALFLGMGTYTPVAAGFPGAGHGAVIAALDFLIGQTNALHSLGMPEYPLIDLSGRRVAVLGGGDTAMDCVRTAVRQGAKSVTCVYRRDRDNMPGSQREVDHAMTEGVKFRFNSQPLAIEVARDERMRAVRVVETELAPEPASRRLRPRPVAGSEALLEADATIVAFGFRPSPPGWFAELGVQIHPDGRVKVAGGDATGQTTNPRVFAGGDMVRGADLVVTAIADGREAATGIIRELESATASV